MIIVSEELDYIIRLARSDGVDRLAEYIQQSPTLDTWAKEAVKRVINEFRDQGDDEIC